MLTFRFAPPMSYPLQCRRLSRRNDGWTFSVTPVFLGRGSIGKTARLGLPVVDIDADFSDILDNLDFAAMAIVDARELWGGGGLRLGAESRGKDKPVRKTSTS